MKLFLTFLTLSLLNNLIAQSTVIEFNYQDESYTYYKITKKGVTKEIDRPFAYNGIPVKIVIKDLNTFCYDVKFTSKSFEQKPLNSDQNIQSLLSNYSGKMNSSNGNSNGSNAQYNPLYQDGNIGIEGAQTGFGMAPGAFEAEYEILDNQSKVLDQANSDMIKASQKIEALLEYNQLAEFTNTELLKLMKNPNIGEAEMKKRAAALAANVFNGTVELSQVIEISNSKTAEIKKQMGLFMSAHNTFETNTEMIKGSMAVLDKKVKDENFKSSISLLSNQIDERQKRLELNKNELATLLNTDINAELRTKLMEVYSNYDDIMNADFKYEYTLNTDQDMTRLTMEFGQANVDSSRIIKKRYLDIPTHGGLRINSSAGMSFMSYMKGQSTYYNNAGVIGEVKGDLFTPALTTMFHFYRQSYKPFTIGGSFGLSVPIEGEKEFMYMTGVSGIIGKSQRIVINLGAFGGKTNRLDRELKVGDTMLSTDSEIPVRRVFDFGLYVGMTFNISSLF